MSPPLAGRFFITDPPGKPLPRNSFEEARGGGGGGGRSSTKNGIFHDQVMRSICVPATYLSDNNLTRDSVRGGEWLL